MTCPSCPKCGAETITTRSGTISGQWKRRCMECKTEFRTVEIYEHTQEAVQFTRHLLGIVGDNGGEK